MNNKAKKTISVILPAYNAEKYIEESIESILKQTFNDFELIVINDGSTDQTKEKILSFTDKRIRYIENKKNLGLIDTLNKGLFFSNGVYIARMDADDLCKENRFEKQIDFFLKDRDVDILGTNIHLLNSESYIKYKLTNEENRFEKQIDFFLKDRDVDILGTNIHLLNSESYIKYKLTNEENRIELLLQPVVAHPSVMMKKESIQKHRLFYDKAADCAEDYKLWIDATLCGLSIKNIGEYLLDYRIHTNQISTKYRQQQIEISNYIRIVYAECFFKSIIKGNEREYLCLMLGVNLNFREQKREIHYLFDNLLHENNVKGYFDRGLFELFLRKRLIAFEKQNNLYTM